MGKYTKKWFVELKDSVVDRDYVINKMNIISEDRMKRDRSLGQKSNKVIIKQVEIPNYTINHKTKGVRVSDDTILKEVAKSK